MKITVCQLPDGGDSLDEAWSRLVAHTRSRASDLVLLPELPFSPWLARSSSFRGESWQAAVEAHVRWEVRFAEFGPARLAGTRPVDFGNGRNNAAFLWDADQGLRSVHAKSRLENREGCWEPIWYVSSPREFTPVAIGASLSGFLIGAELLDIRAVEEYWRAGVTLLITPRSTPAGELHHWLGAAANAAKRGHAFSASSNRAPDGGGWIVDPEGKILALTDASEPFVTVDLQLPASPQIARQRREQQPHPASITVPIPGANPANPHDRSFKSERP
ncbi:MAG TPA: nitrilase-related carbon-nitrogen hydrolase [Steroidobacteraceae bacterium]|nr:nitrilase-related carbon-nitrogen hydrolase [Steroidobacteraceae bacterium]